MNSSWEAVIGSVRVVFGEGRLGEIAESVDALGCRRPLVVSDSGLRAAGHLDRLETTLTEVGYEFSTVVDLTENPTTDQVEAVLRTISARPPDCIIPLGGGSAMDCAKGINFLLTNGGKMNDYWGIGLAKKPLLPAIGVPTTAGTGSEAQSYALITDPESHRKMACGDPSARFHTVILDPTLLSSVPREVAAATGLDAVSHALETFVSTRSNPASRLLSKRSWELLSIHLVDSLQSSAPSETRGQVLLAAHFAGAAIEQSMLGAAHACANPLTAAYGLTHGKAVALMLPHVIRFNGSISETDYLELATAGDLDTSIGGTEALAQRVEEIRKQAELPASLQELKILEPATKTLAAAADLEWTGKFNPRPMGPQEFESLYESASHV